MLGLVTGGFRFIHEYLTTGATRARFEAFTRALLRPSYDEVGFASASGDTDDRRALRAALLGTLGTTGGDPEIVAASRAALDRALGGGRPLDASVADAIVRVAAQHGDAKLYDALMAAADRVTSPDEHYRYLYAVADFQDPALIDRALQYSRSPQLRSQDTAIYLGRQRGRTVARVVVPETALGRARIEDCDFVGRRQPGKLARLVLQRRHARRHTDVLHRAQAPNRGSHARPDDRADQQLHRVAGQADTDADGVARDPVVTVNAEAAEAAEKKCIRILCVLCELCVQTSYFP